MSVRVSLVGFAFLLVACGSVAGSGGATDLRGRTFLSTAVTENGQPKQLVAGTRILVNFAADGTKIGANAGCNHMGGDARVENGKLIVGELAQTLMGCDQGRNEQDAWVATLLTAKPTIQLSGAELVIKSATAEVRLVDRKVADPDRPLAGTLWTVESIIDGQVASSIPMRAVAHFTLNPDGAFSGNTGCNQMGGTIVVSATTLRFSGVFTTKMACEPDRMRLEQAVLDVLRDEVTYRIDADALHLSHPSGKGLVLRAG
jgi:heat shock protein HslJ